MAMKSALESAVKKTKKTKGKKKGERGNKYERLVKPKLPTIAMWKRMDLSDEDIAKKLSIALSTFKVYKNKYEELSAALCVGAEDACARVENGLFERGCGIKVTLKKPIKVKRKGFDEKGRLIEYEEVVYADEEVFIPPDTKADEFYLTRRNPERWGQKQEAQADTNGAQEENETGIVLIPEVMKE